MQETVKKTYRLYRRGKGSYYIQNNRTRQQESLGTANKEEAQRILDAKNLGHQIPSLNLQLGKAYLTHADPKLATRPWEEAMTELSSHGIESSRKRCEREMKSKAFDIIRKKPIAETTAEDLKAVLHRGGNATNNYLRRLHNLVLGNGWIHWHIIPPKLWEKCAEKERRAISFDEHQAIISAEKNDERRRYYEMLWLIGSAQTDCSLLRADNIDWDERVLSYKRKKTGEWSSLKIGQSLEKLLLELPNDGFLFPKIALMKDKDRSSEFRRRCLQLKLENISLHSYRYAWAERAYKSGYSERFAQAALGHKSSAVHHAYARNAQVVCPALEDEQNKVISIVELETKETAVAS